MVKLYYYSRLSEEIKNSGILDELYGLTKNIEKDYPKHYSWFHDKFVKELDGKKREIIFYADDNIIYGVAFLKKSENEKKICTIMVNEKFRNKGIGTIILEEAFQFLGTCKPLITMPDYKEICFRKIIDKYKWEQKQSIDSCYSKNKEIIFNGFL